MRKTKISSTSMSMFGAATANFYPNLFGTPAADIAKAIAFKAKDCNKMIVDEFYEEDGIGCDPSEEFEGKYEIYVPKEELVPEEFFKANNIDKFVNESIHELKSQVAQGLYPEGSIQRTMVDYMIQGLEGIKNRDLVLGTNGYDSLNYPGGGIESKFANYTLIPKLTKEVEKDGEIVVQYPEGFAEEDEKSLDYFFRPRSDQEMAKYTNEELQEAADKVNFGGFNRIGIEYTNTLTDIHNLTAMQDLDPTQKEAIKNKLFEEMDKAEAEMRKAMQVSDNDPVALRMFNDNEGQFSDTISRGGRSFVGNIQSFDMFKEYLDAGFDVQGIAEYKELALSAKSTYDTINGLSKDTATNLGDLNAALKELSDAVDKLPPKGSDENARKQWYDNIAAKIEKVNQEYEKTGGKLEFVNKEFPMPDENMEDKKELARLKKDRNDYIANWESSKKKQAQCFTKEGDYGRRFSKLNNQLKGYLDGFGKHTTAERRASMSEIMHEVTEMMSGMGKEVTELKNSEPSMSDNLKNAIDKVADLSKPEKKTTPKNFYEALRDLKVAADRDGNPKLAEWADNNLNYYENRMGEMGKKGVLLDEPLEAQRAAINNPDGKKIDAALAKFDTQRSKIFGGWGQAHGKETQEHKDLREAAEELVRAKEELNNIKDKSSVEWIEKASEVMRLTGNVKDLSETYVGKKNSIVVSPAGRDRLQGAKDLAAEADAYRITLRKQIDANRRYKDILDGPKAPQNELEANAPRNERKSVKTNIGKLRQEMQAENEMANPGAGRKTVHERTHSVPKKEEVKGRMSKV